MGFLWLWPFCVVIISLTHMLPARLLALTLYTCAFIQINFFVRLWSWTVIISAAFNFFLSQSRCSLKPKNFLKRFFPLKPLLRGSEHPQKPHLHLCSLSCWLCLFLESCVFYLILFPAGFSNIHPGQWHEINLFSQEK